MDLDKLQKLYFDFYYWGKKKILSKYNRKVTGRYTNNHSILTAEEAKQIKEFWAPYAKVDLIFHAFYKEKCGLVDPRCLPTDLYVNEIDEHFNDLKASHILDNKCLYPRLFPDIPQPEMVVYRMSDYWYNGQGQRVSWQEAQELLDKEPAIFAKIAAGSCSGKGVFYISNENGSVAEQFKQQIKFENDIVVQRPVVQHPVFATMNGSSVNTLRILSVLTEEGVKVYSALVRIGVDNRKVDNRGLSCGVQSDGKLNAKAYRLNGECFTKHPNHDFTFEGYQLVGFDKAKALIEKAHPMVPCFRMISWDIAINEQGEPVMLEANFARGCLDFHQLNNGPLFGEDTKKILDEVFGKNK